MKKEVIRFDYIELSLFNSKCIELESELRIVGNNLKSMEANEEKVNKEKYVGI